MSKKAKETYHHGNLREQLIEAGIQLVHRDGMNGFSLRKVAAECGVSHAAPYSHFKDVEELKEAMSEHVNSEFEYILMEAVGGCKEDADQLEEIGCAYIRFFMEHPTYYRFLFDYSATSIHLTVDDRGDVSQGPFGVFRKMAAKFFEEWEVPVTDRDERLAGLWAMVQGVVSLAVSESIHYEGDWVDVFRSLVGRK